MTSITQIKQRKDAVDQVKQQEFKKIKAVFDAEDQKYNNNAICESKIVNMLNTHMTKVAGDNNQTHIPITNFTTAAEKLTYDVFITFKTKLKIMDIVSFVQVRSDTVKRGMKISYVDVPKKKPVLFERMWFLHNAPTKERKYPCNPVPPSID